MPETVKDKNNYSFVEYNCSNFFVHIPHNDSIILLPRLTKVLHIFYLKYGSRPAESRYTKLSFFYGNNVYKSEAQQSKERGLVYKREKEWALIMFKLL